MNEEYQPGQPVAPAPAEPPPPAIYIKSLKPGTVLLLEGETDIYEITMRYPEHGIAEVSSNNRALCQPTVGQFMHSVRWSDPGTKLNAIQKGWAMVLRFSNGTMQTQPILSAGVNGVGVDGTRWHYDVF